jgi:pimeloyl-ACP methyl ester carboxylesterase
MAATVAALGLAGCSGGADDAPSRQAAEYDIPSLEIGDLHGCQNRPPDDGWRCGRIEVPFERADASYGTTHIGFAVRRHAEAGPAAGAIFAVEGGPGYASTTTPHAYKKLFRPFLGERDLVLVDMRGTGRSGALHCPDVQRARAPDAIATAECAQHLGKRFESYRTSAAADDIDDVRKALGYERITLYGDSYGTFLGQSFAFRHPETLNAVVLDSAYPAFGEDPWYPSLPRTAIRSLALACERSASCSGDPVARLERLVDKLRTKRISVGPLIDALQGLTYGTPGSYLRLDRAAAAYLAGDSGPYEALTASKQGGSRHVRKYAAAGEWVFGCNDYPMIWKRLASEPERREQLDQAIRDYPRKTFEPFTPREIALSAESGYLECLTWPSPTDLYEPPVDPRADEPTRAPVLVVSGEMDSLTTPSEGRTVAGFFPNGEQFIAKNAGHVDALYYADDDAARAIQDFLHEVLDGAPRKGG